MLCYTAEKAHLNLTAWYCLWKPTPDAIQVKKKKKKWRRGGLMRTDSRGERRLFHRIWTDAVFDMRHVSDDFCWCEGDGAGSPVGLGNEEKKGDINKLSFFDDSSTHPLPYL